MNSKASTNSIHFESGGGYLPGVTDWLAKSKPVDKLSIVSLPPFDITDWNRKPCAASKILRPIGEKFSEKRTLSPSITTFNFQADACASLLSVISLDPRCTSSSTR